jgi:hypothetical protein
MAGSIPSCERARTAQPEYRNILPSSLAVTIERDFPAPDRVCECQH